MDYLGSADVEMGVRLGTLTVPIPRHTTLVRPDIIAFPSTPNIPNPSQP